MGTLLSNILPSTCLLYFSLWICFSSCVVARPSKTFNSDTQDEAGFGFGVWVAAAAGFVCVSLSLAVCVCCRKPKGFAEFRSSTQLAEISSAPPAEVTLFPPPSLLLNREDLEVSFEPLPRPQHQAVNTYRPKEVNEWIENGQGLFPRYNIQYLREFGRGWFGQVVEAEVKDLVADQVTSRCVVKILRPEASVSQHSKFLKDVQPLLKLDHPHVMKLYGCCLETSPFLVLLQHCANGDLKQFLAAYSPSKGSQGVPPLPENVLLRMACEAAEGLSKWHEIGFCHPDVAARSYMVTGDMSVVIGDYGTHTVAYRDDFLDTGNQLLPIRWCAPECFEASGEVVQTQGGNIWSFGIVLWEILSIGARPYAALTDEQVLQQVVQEKRTILNPPSFNYQQNQALYQLMLHCWEVDAPLRPRMEVVASRLAAACAGVSRDVELDLERAFDSRWNAAKPSKSSLSEQDEESPSASLNNLHGSLDNLEEQSKEILSPGTDKESESGFSAKVSAALRSLDEALAAAEDTDEEDNDDVLPEPSFELGDLQAEQVEVGQETDHSSNSSGSLFSSRSWQDKVVRGDLTALVREKSRSVQDLMVLTHVEPMSDIEFLSFNQASKSDQRENTSQPIPPQISVTSPSSTVRSPMMESDVPLLESNNESSNAGKDCLDTGTYMERNRNRLTSTPREDTNFEAMESSFRDRSKPAEYAPFSPESLDATNFTQKDQRSLEPPPPMNASTSVILGPSDELGLNVFQGVTSRTQSEDEDPFDEPEGAVAVIPAKSTAEASLKPSPVEPARLAVNLEAWNNFLEQSYPHQHPSGLEHAVEDISDTPLQLKDSGIARPSFSTSVDVLGSTLGNEESVNREWMDDLSLVARMWNEELAAALALDSSLLQGHQLNASLTDTDPNMEDAVANVSGLSVDYSSPSKREETYFSYDKIDEDIREEERAVRSKDLSTIREERESVSSTEMGATPHNNAETGRGLLSQLQLKNRMQRHLDLSGSSDSDGSEDCRDDDEDVLVVDLENKRAVMLEGQSPKLRAAIATQNYEDIFVVRPTNAHSIMENGKSPSYNGVDPTSSKGAEAIVDSERDNDDDREDDYEDEANGEEEEGDDGEIVNDFEDDDDDDDDEEGDEGIAVSNFTWQACYPAKLNQSFSMEVIEEESENEDQEDEEVEAFVPSIWRADATPTRPAIKTPEKSLGNSPRDNASNDKKNVSFSQKKKKDVYQYPAEVEEPPPTRRQWGAPASVIQQPKESSYADFADWDFAAADEDRESENEFSKDVDDHKPVIPRPSNPLSSNMLYRLSGIENESEDDDENKEQDAALPQFDARPNESLFGEWQSPFNLSEFQPNQFFPNWDNSSSTTTNNEEPSELPSNGHENGKEELNVVGTLRHTLDSGRLRLDLSPSTRFEDSDA